MLKPKIAFHCSGSFTPFFYRYARFDSFISPVFYLQNFKGVRYLRREKGSEDFLWRYQFDDFNDAFAQNKPTYNVNYNIIYQADKAHYKRFSGSYVRKVIDTYCSIFDDWLKRDAPDFVFFPIIESLDAMALYEMCRLRGVKTICYAHARLLPLSFLSPNKCETFPNISDQDWDVIGELSRTDEVGDVIDRITSGQGRLSDQMKANIVDLTSGASNNDLGDKNGGFLSRYLLNILYKVRIEKHNRLLRNFIKLQVALEKLLLPVQKYYYSLIERFYLKPLMTSDFPVDYGYFPLHFSPESSINTPAPYYIDQLRVVDKILLEDSRPLVIREHPSVYGKRPFSFYRAVKDRPNVYFSSMKSDYQKELAGAYCVYTVTGTVGLECFLRDKNFKQFGENFVSDFLKQLGDRDGDRRRLFLAAIQYLSGSFLIISPTGYGSSRTRAIYSDKNFAEFKRSLHRFVSIEGNEPAFL